MKKIKYLNGDAIVRLILHGKEVVLNVLLVVRNSVDLVPAEVLDLASLIPDAAVRVGIEEVENVPVIRVLVVDLDAALTARVVATLAAGTVTASAANAVNHGHVRTNLALTNAEIHDIRIGDIIPRQE